MAAKMPKKKKKKEHRLTAAQQRIAEAKQRRDSVVQEQKKATAEKLRDKGVESQFKAENDEEGKRKIAESWTLVFDDAGCCTVPALPCRATLRSIVARRRGLVATHVGTAVLRVGCACSYSCWTWIAHPVAGTCTT